MNSDNITDFLDQLAAIVHKANAKWWINIEDKQPLSRNFGELIALMHSELSEALEAHRKSLPSDHLPGFLGVEEEFADLLIRLLDASAGLGVRLGDAFVAKMAFNATREDHTLEHRRAPSGKKY